MKKTVTIAIPSRDSVHMDFALSLVALMARTKTPSFVANIRSSILPVSRSMLVEQAQSNESSHILFLDSDMVFPPDILDRLLSYNLDIVGATYCQREGPLTPMGCDLEMKALPKVGLVRARRLPMGCMLINMSVFEKMQKPYFRWELRENNSKVIGEDVEFCDRAQQLGFQVWCDMEISKNIGHIGQVVRYIG
jgi:hypothetical protein